jgi:DNA polymerase IV
MILHIDMDAFYASIEEREQPSLRGQPVIVGGTPQSRGVVAAANYVARTFGVHSAMSSVQAFKLCPQAVVLPPRMEFYAAVSKKIRDIFHRYTPVVEPLSLDEAFLDANQSTALFGTVETIGRRIQHDILDELNLVASVGLAPNKFLAKLASDLEKPNGFTVIPADQIQQTLDPLPVSRIWGVGKVTSQRLQQLDVNTIGDLRNLSLPQLQQLFGQMGKHFWKLARGIDERRVVPDREARSISHETTFATDIADIQVIRAWMMELTEQVARRLRRNELTARTIHLKVRYSDFATVTRSHTLSEPTNATRPLWESALRLLTTQLPERRLNIRLLGVGTSGLKKHAAIQRSLFEEPQIVRETRIDTVADQIRSRFGSAALRRASVVEHNVEHRAQPRPEQDSGADTPG